MFIFHILEKAYPAVIFVSVLPLTRALIANICWIIPR